MKKHIIDSLRVLIVLTLITGILYPLLVTVTVRILFPREKEGSLIVRKGKIVGSELIGQRFRSAKNFWPRPSATGYDPLPSGASNWGPTSSGLRDSVARRRHEFIRSNALPDGTPVPSEMLFASGSGIDPHISPDAAMMQVGRIAMARGFDERGRKNLVELIKRRTEGPQFGFFGEPRVNVLMLNLDLDELGDSDRH